MILRTVGAMAAEGGLRSVTMSRLAERAGIGRATLYRYFPDMDAVLAAWHEAQVAGHVAHLSAIADRAGRSERLRSVLEAFAFLAHHRQGHGDIEDELIAGLHEEPHVGRARDDVTTLVAKLIGEAARDDLVRDDVAPHELACFCMHALGAAADLPSNAAVRRLVALIWAGLQPE